VLTYVGPVDEANGITKQFVVDDVLGKHYSYPGEGLSPVQANFSGPSQVYAVPLTDALMDSLWGTNNLNTPAKYNDPIGIIEQMQVPDGILNITTEHHTVYPGTIRRTVIEKDGQLFIHTSGVGVNRMHNLGSPTPITAASTPGVNIMRGGAYEAAARANDLYGPKAFAALDQQAVKYINSKRR